MTEDEIIFGLRQYRRALNEERRLRARIENALDGVPDGMQRQVLTRRYIDGEPWWKIADSLYISDRWAKALHKKAIGYLAGVHTSSRTGG